MDAEMTKEEFMKLPTAKIKEIVIAEGLPKVGVLIPDGTRKSATILNNLNSNMDNFEEELFSKVNQKLMKVIEIMFSHGVHTLFIPSLTHGNLRRSKKYVDSAINIGLKYILKDRTWFDFYKKYDIKVRVYGDLNLFKEMGYDHIINWVNEVQEATSDHKNHKLFFGLACSNKYEIPRLIDMGIDFHEQKGRYPSLEEKIEMYYGELIDEVDFFIRPTILRDSDIQPPLISGNKTQMYFPVLPFIYLTKEIFREIIYDLLYLRTITFGLDNYDLNTINKIEKDILKEYYKNNEKSVIGVGKRIGNLWIPLPQIKYINSKNR